MCSDSIHSLQNVSSTHTLYYRMCSLQNVFSTECVLTACILYRMCPLHIPCISSMRSLQNVFSIVCSLQNVFSTECVLYSVFSTECVLYRMCSPQDVSHTLHFLHLSLQYRALLTTHAASLLTPAITHTPQRTAYPTYRTLLKNKIHRKKKLR